MAESSAEVSSIAKGSKAWALKVQREAVELAKTAETNEFALGKILWDVFNVPVDGDPKLGAVYKVHFGFDNLGDWAESKLNLHRRKAERLCRMWKVLEVDLADVPKDIKRKLHALGGSKLRLLTRDNVINAKNAEKWAEKASAMTYPELDRTVNKYLADKEKKRIAAEEAAANTKEDKRIAAREAKEPEEDEDELPPAEKSKLFQFTCFDESIELVEQALVRAGELSHSEVKGYNIGLICMDFVATNDWGKAKDPKARLRYLAKVERLLGVKIVAFDEKIEKVVYGLPTLKKFGRE